MSIMQKNNFTPVLIGMLLIALVTLVFTPLLPDSHSPCGTRISYAALLRDVWDKKIAKKQGVKSVASSDCK